MEIKNFEDLIDALKKLAPKEVGAAGQEDCIYLYDIWICKVEDGCLMRYNDEYYMFDRKIINLQKAYNIIKAMSEVD